MSYENSAGIGVYASYGKRDTGGSVGLEQVDNSTQRLSIAFTGVEAASFFSAQLKRNTPASNRIKVCFILEVFFGLDGKLVAYFSLN